MNHLGIVVIGRNEGERLKKCIQSVQGSGNRVIYVDSGSKDGSADWVRSQGITVVDLDASKPMSAARARNAGFARLKADNPEIQFVQFVDGDCVICKGWLLHGQEYLAHHSDAGIVCGRVIEQHPEASIYNRLCSLEWQKIPGEIQACGGIFMVLASAFQSIDGFRIDVMAAEDDELCLRMRRSGLKIISIDHDMVFHDAAITRFSQWWTRAKRTGMAYAHGAALHGHSADKHFTRQCKRAWIWGLGVPILAVSLALPTLGFSLLGFGGYPLLATKVYWHGRKRGWSRSDAGLVAISNVISKFPELQGIIHYHYRTRWQRQQVNLIEYKGLKDS